MKKELASNPKYANMKLDAVVYGDDLSDKSYREATGLFDSYPNLKGIIAPTTVGVAAAGKAITDKRPHRQGAAHRPRPSLRDEILR